MYQQISANSFSPSAGMPSRAAIVVKSKLMLLTLGMFSVSFSMGLQVLEKACEHFLEILEYGVLRDVDTAVRRLQDVELDVALVAFHRSFLGQFLFSIMVHSETGEESTQGTLEGGDISARSFVDEFIESWGYGIARSGLIWVGR